MVSSAIQRSQAVVCDRSFHVTYKFEVRGGSMRNNSDVNCRHNGARVYRRNGASSKCSKNSLGHPFQNVIFTSFLH